jgi:hypothetical protein
VSEFTNLLKEAFAGQEPYDPAPGRAALEEAIRGFARRERLVRGLMWFAVAAAAALCAWSAWRFLAAGDDAGPKRLLLYATLFLFGGQAIGWAKMFLFTNQQNLAIQTELKRVQLQLSDRS